MSRLTRNFSSADGILLYFDNRNKGEERMKNLASALLKFLTICLTSRLNPEWFFVTVFHRRSDFYPELNIYYYILEGAERLFDSACRNAPEPRVRILGGDREGHKQQYRTCVIFVAHSRVVKTLVAAQYVYIYL